MIIEEVPLFGLISVCHGDWFCLCYIFVFHYFVKNRYHVSMHKNKLLCSRWPSFWVMGDRDYVLIDSHKCRLWQYATQCVLSNVARLILCNVARLIVIA